MADLVVTVPKWFWFDWIDEGDPAGSRETGDEWGFTCGWHRPPAEPGDRCYIVGHDRLRGYAPITRILADGEHRAGRGYAICRKGGAVAVTIAASIAGFRGWRTRWWQRDEELPFDKWRTDSIAPEWFRKHALNLLEDLYTKREARQWLRLPQLQLGGRRPEELINLGRGAEVLVPIHQLRDGAYT